MEQNVMHFACAFNRERDRERELLNSSFFYIFLTLLASCSLIAKDDVRAVNSHVYLARMPARCRMEDY